MLRKEGRDARADSILPGVGVMDIRINLSIRKGNHGTKEVGEVSEVGLNDHPEMRGTEEFGNFI